MSKNLIDPKIREELIKGDPSVCDVPNILDNLSLSEEQMIAQMKEELLSIYKEIERRRLNPQPGDSTKYDEFPLIITEVWLNKHKYYLQLQKTPKNLVFWIDKHSFPNNFIKAYHVEEIEL